MMASLFLSGKQSNHKADTHTLHNGRQSLSLPYPCFNEKVQFAAEGKVGHHFGRQYALEVGFSVVARS